MTQEEDDTKESFEEPDFPETTEEFEVPSVPETNEPPAIEPAEFAPRSIAAAPRKRGPFPLALILLLVVVVGGVGLFLLAQNLIAPESEVAPLVPQKNRIVKTQQQPESLPAEGVTQEVVSPDKVAVPLDEVPPQVEKSPAAAAAEPPAQVEKPPVVQAAEPIKTEPTPQFALKSGRYLSAGGLKKAMTQIEKMGYVTIRSTRTEKYNMTRLLVDRYSKPQAEARLVEIRPLAKGAFMVAENGQFTVYAGSFLSPDNARRQAEKLRKKGLGTKEVVVPVDLSGTSLKFGSFSSRDEALKIVAQLKKKGLSDLQVIPVK